MPAIIGVSLSIGAATLNVNDIIASAWGAANSANVHQIRTVLELYYLDHDSYPRVATSQELFDELFADGYIENKPLNPQSFLYNFYNNGESYKFSLASGEN